VWLRGRDSCPQAPEVQPETFLCYAEPKTAKNRLHFDLRAPGDMAEQVSRLEALGATVIRCGEAITVMRDPEGNEFCVEPRTVELIRADRKASNCRG
jgi:Glyoxalase-like domain